MTDAASFCERLRKKPDIIVIAGDLAFVGGEAEYKFATAWLEKLCIRCGLTLSRAFVIPENHDVVRSTAKQTLVHVLHKEIRGVSAISGDLPCGCVPLNNYLQACFAAASTHLPKLL